MDFLKTYWFVAFLISILYFIVKTLLLRFSEKDKKEEKKSIMKDGFLVFIISYLVLVFKDKIFSLDSSSKTHVFTNEPNF
jgi:hypothetical protein